MQHVGLWLPRLLPRHGTARASPASEGFFHELVAAHDEGRIQEEELVANLILLFCAGHDTVINLFGNGMLALFRHPRQMQILGRSPALIRGAIEEFLR